MHSIDHSVSVTPPGSERASIEPVVDLDQRRRDFLRMVSHELRTPLNSILGFADILAQELYGPLGSSRYRDGANIILESGKRLLTLANQVIEIAKLEGHAADIKLSRQSLDHAFDDVIDSLREDIERTELKIQFVCRGELPEIIADERGLRTVLRNLIHNTCVHAPQSSVLLVQTRPAPDGVEITLTDNGPGVAFADLDRIAAPFEQAGETLVRPNQGAGLGLPIVRLFCRAMGGTMQISLPEAGGFRVTLRLPSANPGPKSPV